MSGLPDGWAELSLIEACKKITDGTHHSPPNTATGEFKYVTAKNIKRHGLDLADLTYVSAEVHRAIYERCPVEKGDVLYIKDGATTGLAINNPLDEPFSLLSSVALLKPDRRLLDERYLRHWLNSPETLASMIGQMSGSAIKRLTLTTISGQRLPLPPLAEQRRIVKKLDALTARTARARVDLDRIPALAARYKQAVLAKAFSGELTAEWRSHNTLTAVRGTVDQIRSQRSADKKLARRCSVASEPDAELPATWDWVSPDEVADNTAYSLGIGPFGSNLVQADYRESGTRLIFVRDIRRARFDHEGARYVTPEKASSLHQHMVSGGEVLITKMGDPPGDTALYARDGALAVITADCVKLKPNPELATAEFLVFAIRADVVKSQLAEVTAGVAQQKISLERFRKIALPIPPLDEQFEIVRRVETAFAEIDRLTAEAAAARRLLDRLDQAILAKAFRGELIPQDPADEPAGVLLERIRAERAAAPKPKRGRRKAVA